MKKIISILLLSCLLLTCFAGCAFGSRNVDRKLISTLVNYLETYFWEYDMIGLSSEGKIDQIKNGAQPLHVAFDPEDYYFVCGYYNDTHENGNESSMFCCAKEYKWVKFESADKIRESYLGAEFVVAFQINRALFVKDLSANKDYRPGMEHFQMYKPKFVNGLNTNAPVEFDKTFIYLNGAVLSGGFTEKFKGTVYCSVKQHTHRIYTISCTCLEDQYYIPIHTYTIDSNGEIYSDSTNYLTKDFGAYYDAIVDTMETGRYSVKKETGIFGQYYISHYGLISVDDFANKIIK